MSSDNIGVGPVSPKVNRSADTTEKLGLTKQWISSEVAKLKNLDLVESQERRKGYWLTKKGIAYARLLKEKDKKNGLDAMGKGGGRV